MLVGVTPLALMAVDRWSCSRAPVTANSCCSRRDALAMITLLPPLPALAARPGCKTSSNPSITVVACNDFGVQPNGRLVGCDADEACVATGAVSNPSKFASPWAPDDLSPESKDIQRAWRSLVDAVETESGLDLVTIDAEQHYLRASGASKVPPDGTDDVEFLLTTSSNGVTALFRSATRQRVYVYPLQQPIPNQESHLARLKAIRAKLGWRELGYAGDVSSEGDSLEAVPNLFGLRFRGAYVPDYDNVDE